MKSPTWQPLGDQAVLGYADSETQAANWAETVRRQGWPWVEDVVQAYQSLAIYFDAKQIDFETARARIASLCPIEIVASEETCHRIPVCYERGPDLERIARHVGRDRDEVIALHAATTYTVYAIGFCPGFPYLGYLPELLSGVPRLPSPRLRVEAGSVGLTGRQTGIYTEPRPGGWNLIGQTPLELVSVADGYFPLRTGDAVRFHRIDEAEFTRQRGERL